MDTTGVTLADRTCTGQEVGALNTSAIQFLGFDESYRTTKYVRGQDQAVDGTMSAQVEANAEVDALTGANQNCGR